MPKSKKVKSVLAWAFASEDGTIYMIYPPSVKRSTFEPYNKERLIRIRIVPAKGAKRGKA